MMIIVMIKVVVMMMVMQVNFTVVAREVAAGGRESRASVVVHVRDLNDNPPIFLEVSGDKNSSKRFENYNLSIPWSKTLGNLSLKPR